MVQEAIAKLLAKRARSDVASALEPMSKRRHAVTPTVDDCVELCSLLLEKVGADLTHKTDSATIAKLMSTEYSPRVVDLLANIASGLQKGFPIDSGSDITESSEDEDTDAVVPSAAHETRIRRSRQPRTDGVVPLAPLPVPQTASPVPELAVQSVPSSKTAPAAAYKKETEIAISRIFELGKTASVLNPHIPATAPYDGPSVITMSGFGELGRFGNQVLQYMFLKCYAKAHNTKEIQVPSWVGAGLFGLNDQEVQRAFPSAVEFKGTLANSTFTDDFIDYVKNSQGNHNVTELTPACLNSSNNNTPVNVDIWGWFQWHTSHFAEFKELIQDTFSPVSELQMHCSNIFNQNLRYRDGVKHTIVGLHLRLGDYQNIAASSFGYCAPTSWYLELLAKLWPTLENPILFVASDDLNSVLRDFAAYEPVTADSIGLRMPESMKNLKAGFFPDWWCLTQCDVLAISNSTFSLSACMMNQQPKARFYRAHYKDRMVPIDPWNTDVIVHRDMKKAGVSAALETLQVLYNTQGSKGLARNLLYELPYYGIRAAIMKAVLWRQAQQKIAALA